MGTDQEELDKTEAQVKKTSGNGIKEMLDKAMLSYERLPMLEIVFDRFVRTLSTSFRTLTAENVEVDIKQISSLRFGDFMNGVPVPSLIVVFKVVEWEDYGIAVIDNNLVYVILDTLFGGRKNEQVKVDGRPYTKIEQNVVRQIADILLNDIGASFDDLSPATFQFERLETNPKFATISRVGDAAILLQLKVSMDDGGGKIDFLLPYATLEPIKPLLLQVYMGEKYGKDSAWETMLESEILSTIVQVEAVLNTKSASLQQVSKLKVGSTILMDNIPNEEILLQCSKIPMFTGKLGRMGNQVAVSIAKSANKKIRENI